MSKSKGNVVDPDTMRQKVGADALRALRDVRRPAREGGRVDATPASTAASAGWLGSGGWPSSGAQPAGGAAPIDAATLTAAERALRRKTHDTIRRVTADIDVRKQMNTAISAMMELVNDLYLLHRRPARRAVAAGGRGGPRGDRVAGAAGVALCAAHRRGAVGGLRPRRRPGGGALAAGRRGGGARRAASSCRCRSTARCAAASPSTPDTTADELERLALADPAVLPHLAGKTVKKVVVAAGRLVSVVVA